MSEKEAIATLLVFNLANNLQHISDEDFGIIKKANRTLINLTEKLQKELQQEKENQKQNFIHKDKIKAKIEDLEGILDLLENEKNYPKYKKQDLIEEIIDFKELLEE